MLHGFVSDVENNQRIVVIGASAGGVQALMRLAERLPASFPAPILVVLHIGEHRSHMPELLGARGPLKAVLGANDVAPEAGHIYLAPPDQHMLLEDGRLRLLRGPKEHHARPAIDPLFRSAALGAGARVIGVVLTGMLDDGTAGLRAIQVCGGTTVVQDPEDAAEPSMPLSVLSSMAVDHVWRLDDMAHELDRLAQPVRQVHAVSAPEWLRTEHAVSLGSGSIAELNRIGSPSTFTCPDCGGALFELKDDKPLRYLCHTGHAFSLRSLAWMQDQVTEQTMWSALRALQEKEAILRRSAAVEASEGGRSEAETLAEADKLGDFIEDMRKIVRSAPVETTNEGPLEVPNG